MTRIGRIQSKKVSQSAGSEETNSLKQHIIGLEKKNKDLEEENNKLTDENTELQDELDDLQDEQDSQSSNAK